MISFCELAIAEFHHLMNGTTNYFRSEKPSQLLIYVERQQRPARFNNNNNNNDNNNDNSNFIIIIIIIIIIIQLLNINII